MSTYIYPAYLYKDKATFEDIESLIKELKSIREQYIPYVVNIMLEEPLFTTIKERYFSSPEKAWESYTQRTFYNDVVKDTECDKRYSWLDIQCDLVVYFHDNKLVVHEFSSRNLKDFFSKRFKYKDYSLYDIYAGDEKITKKKAAEYAEKKEFYDSLFAETGIPSNVGLVFSIYNKDDIFEIESQITDKLFGKFWYRPFLKNEEK